MVHDANYVRVTKIKRCNPETEYNALTDEIINRPACFLVDTAASSLAAYEARPVRFSIANSSVELFGHEPCHQLASGEWAKIIAIKFSSVHGAAGVTRVYTAHAKLVSETAAKKMNEIYRAKKGEQDRARDMRIADAEYR